MHTLWVKLQPLCSTLVICGLRRLAKRHLIPSDPLRPPTLSHKSLRVHPSPAYLTFPYIPQFMFCKSPSRTRSLPDNEDIANSSSPLSTERTYPVIHIVESRNMAIAQKGILAIEKFKTCMYTVRTQYTCSSYSILLSSCDSVFIIPSHRNARETRVMAG